MEYVVLVDDRDHEIGIMEKMEAHQKGLLHRAFSVLLFNSKGEMLLQQRSSTKYHSAGLWTNACCSHPRPGEDIVEACARRLNEEMGIHLVPVPAYTFVYKVTLEHDLMEHELDHVFTGIFDGRPAVNPQEVQDWKFINMQELKRDAVEHPEKYTSWFRIILTHPLPPAPI